MRDTRRIRVRAFNKNAPDMSGIDYGRIVIILERHTPRSRRRAIGLIDYIGCGITKRPATGSGFHMQMIANQYGTKACLTKINPSLRRAVDGRITFNPVGYCRSAAEFRMPAIDGKPRIPSPEYICGLRRPWVSAFRNHIEYFDFA